MQPEVKIITGFIIPAEWDQHGTIIGLSLVTDSFEKFIVGNSEIIAELLKLVDKRVRVECLVVGEDLVGNKIIEIRRYRLQKKLNDKEV